jgi:hypothetical protein
MMSRSSLARRVRTDQRAGGLPPAPGGPPSGRAASTSPIFWQTPLTVSPPRALKLTWVPSVFPLQAATASGGGPGGWPEGALAAPARLKPALQASGRQKIKEANFVMVFDGFEARPSMAAVR